MKASADYKNNKQSTPTKPKEKTETKGKTRKAKEVLQAKTQKDSAKKGLSSAEKLSKLQKKLSKMSDKELLNCNFYMVDNYQHHKIMHLKDNVISAGENRNKAYSKGKKSLIKDAQKKVVAALDEFLKYIDDKEIGDRINYTIKSDGYGNWYDIIKISKTKWRDVANHETLTSKEVINSMMEYGYLHIDKTGYLEVK